MPGGRPETHRRWLRALLSGALAGLAVTALAAPAPITAQDAPAYTPGTAVAEAQPFGATIVYNNANIGVGVAKAGASYASTSAKATAAPFGFGLAQLVAAVEFCGEHPFPPGAAPEPLTASTDDADGQPVDRTGGTEQGVVVAAARVRVSPNADAQADVTAFGFDLPGFAAISGGTAHARATSDPAGKARSAVADTAGDLVLLDGLVRLEGMRFHLAQSSVGADRRTAQRSVESTMVFGTVRIGGLPVQLPDDADQAVATMNTLLGPLGLRVRAPEVVADGTSGYRLTPLTVSIGGDALYNDVVRDLAGNSALIELQRTLHTQLFDSATCAQLGGVMQAFPQLNSTYNAIGMAAPIVLAVLVATASGNGSIDVEFGGARTRIDDIYYPPQAFSRPAPAPPLSTPDPPAAPPPSAPAAPAPPTVVAPPVDQAATVEPNAPVAATSTRCETTSPAARPGCWRGLAPVGALAAVGVTAALLAVDEVLRRRRTLILEAP